MHKKRFAFITLILMLSAALSGCSSLLVRENALIIDQSTTTAISEIKDVNVLGTGIIEDVNSDGSQLLVFTTSKAPPITYNIELYQKNGNSWSVINFLSSDKPHGSGVFSLKNNGVFYTETVNTEDENTEIKQLVWMSLDRATTRVLSDDNENITTPLVSIPDGKVLCANENHQIVIMNAEGRRENYTIDPEFNITSLDFDPLNNRIFLAGTYKNNDITNLYYAELNENALDPILLDQDIIDYDLNHETGNLIYIKKTSNENQLIFFNGENGQTKSLCSADIVQAVLNQDDSAVIYTTEKSVSYPEYQILYAIDINGKNTSQILSPRIISSSLFLRDNTLFVSILEEENNVSNEYESTVFSIEINSQP